MSDAILVGLAGAFLFYLLAYSTVLNKPLDGVRERFPKLIMCGWCAGFWLTGGILIATGAYDPVTHLAATTVVGVIDSVAL